jgi:catechol 2,3-dioxygenase-like lactoylglutathione lyase family enzyme
MAIESLLINVADIEAAVAFYTRFLGAEPVGEISEEAADLDLVTATLRLRRTTAEAPSTWKGDDLQAGFRHVGFKVAELDPLVAELKAAGVPFHLDPIHAEGDVRITFFFDPDGTLVELVEGPLQYHEVYDRAEVEADWGLGVPDRPRFDHVAETVHDLLATKAHYARLGFAHIGGIHQPNDARGYEIDFLRSGDTALEVFTYSRAEKERRAAQLDARGFVAIGLGPDADLDGETVAGPSVDGSTVRSDPDGLLRVAARRSS